MQRLWFKANSGRIREVLQYICQETYYIIVLQSRLYLGLATNTIEVGLLAELHCIFEKSLCVYDMRIFCAFITWKTLKIQ